MLALVRDRGSKREEMLKLTTWGPLDNGGGRVDPEDDKRGLPLAPIVGPNVRITILKVDYQYHTKGRDVKSYRALQWASEHSSCSTPSLYTKFGDSI